jgi:hypothetical protein
MILGKKRGRSMQETIMRPRGITVISYIVFILGVMMLGYWISYIVQGMPREGIPIASEITNAVLALLTAYGLFKIRPWGMVAGFVLAGMWIYGVVGGIALVLAEGLDFSSPIGALTDAIIFPLVLAFSISMVFYLWKRRNIFIDI